jgi:HSP20 family molecular chaperone IbpA
MHEAVEGAHMLTQGTTRWSEVGATSATMNAVSRDSDRWRDNTADDDQDRPLSFFAGTWPRTNVVDAGASVIVTAEVPGLTRDDVTLALSGNVLIVSGERALKVPQSYAVHRQERTQAKFSRTVTLPYEVAEDRTSASVEHGVLTVTLHKAPHEEGV